MSTEEADELSEFFEAQNIGMSFLSVVMIFRSKDHFIRHFGSLEPTILDTGFTPLGLMFRGGDWRRPGVQEALGMNHHLRGLSLGAWTGTGT